MEYIRTFSKELGKIFMPTLKYLKQSIQLLGHTWLCKIPKYQIAYYECLKYKIQNTEIVFMYLKFKNLINNNVWAYFQKKSVQHPIINVYIHFYCVQSTAYCHGMLSVHPSICKLMDCDHTRWNSSKIISRMISLTFLLPANPNITDLLQRKHPKILAGIGVGYGKLAIFYS